MAHKVIRSLSSVSSKSIFLELWECNDDLLSDITSISTLISDAPYVDDKFGLSMLIGESKN